MTGPPKHLQIVILAFAVSIVSTVPGCTGTDRSGTGPADHELVGTWPAWDDSLLAKTRNSTQTEDTFISRIVGDTLSVRMMGSPFYPGISLERRHD